MRLNEPLSCSSPTSLPLLTLHLFNFEDTLHKEGGTSITHLLMLPRAAHTFCCTFKCTGGHRAHCDLPAAPPHPHSQDNPSGSHMLASLLLLPAHRAALLFRKTSPQGQRWTTRPICACLTTDFSLQQVLQVQGCCCSHCSQVQWPPRGTRTPQSAALHPEITK